MKDTSADGGSVIKEQQGQRPRGGESRRVAYPPPLIGQVWGGAFFIIIDTTANKGAKKLDLNEGVSK